MTLVEGRNRQIRKMMQAIGFTVVKLHRVEFMGIALGDHTNTRNGLKRPGDWAYLDAFEMDLVKEALRRSSLSLVKSRSPGGETCLSLDEEELEEEDVEEEEYMSVLCANGQFLTTY
jgi:hypothetical protein